MVWVRAGITLAAVLATAFWQRGVAARTHDSHDHSGLEEGQHDRGRSERSDPGTQPQPLRSFAARGACIEGACARIGQHGLDRAGLDEPFHGAVAQSPTDPALVQELATAALEAAGPRDSSGLVRHRNLPCCCGLPAPSQARPPRAQPCAGLARGERRQHRRLELAVLREAQLGGEHGGFCWLARDERRLCRRRARGGPDGRRPRTSLGRLGRLCHRA